MVSVLYGGFCIILLAVLGIILTPIFRSGNLTFRQRYAVAGIVFVFFFAGSFGVYYGIGAPELVPLSVERQRVMLTIKNNITQYSQQVKEHPDDWQAWAGLGDNFTLTGQYKAAVNAYKEAVKTSNGRADTILAYARSMITEADGVVNDAAKKSLEMVLLQDAKNAEARYWMAVRLLQDGKNVEAMKTMRELYYSLPEGDATKAMIDQQIGNAPKNK